MSICLTASIELLSKEEASKNKMCERKEEVAEREKGDQIGKFKEEKEIHLASKQKKPNQENTFRNQRRENELNQEVPPQRMKILPPTWKSETPVVKEKDGKGNAVDSIDRKIKSTFR